MKNTIKPVLLEYSNIAECLNHGYMTGETLPFTETSELRKGDLVVVVNRHGILTECPQRPFLLMEDTVKRVLKTRVELSKNGSFKVERGLVFDVLIPKTPQHNEIHGRLEALNYYEKLKKRLLRVINHVDLLPFGGVIEQAERILK